MISLMFALLAGSTAVGPQAVQAEFQACALENGRYVCRYVVPDIVIVPVPGTNITADAPAAILGSAPSATEAAAAPRVAVPAIPLDAAPPVVLPTTTGSAASVPAVTTRASTPPVVTPTAPVPPAPIATAAVDPGPIRPIDTGVLTEREAQLVARCADAGWVSLCLPDDRRAARTLRDRQTAYLAVRREVTRLLGEERCDAAVRSALDGGYLSLARETRDYCAASETAPTIRASAAAAPVVVPRSAPSGSAEVEADKNGPAKEAPAKDETKTEAAKAARVQAHAEAAQG